MVSGFEVTRRILVDLEGLSLRRKWLAGLEPENVHMMIGRLTADKSGAPFYPLSVFRFLILNIISGSMKIDCLGILTELSDCKRKLFPVGYQ